MTDLSTDDEEIAFREISAMARPSATSAPMVA